MLKRRTTRHGERSLVRFLPTVTRQRACIGILANQAESRKEKGSGVQKITHYESIFKCLIRYLMSIIEFIEMIC